MAPHSWWHRGLSLRWLSWWCPALPYPGGCSTIGAGGLSFRVRYGAGRGSPAMTTRTGLVGAPAGYCGPPGCGGWCPGGVRAPCSVLVCPTPARAPVWCGPACVVGVGRGPYSGRPPPPGGWSVARSVRARRSLSRARSRARVLCRPVSTGQLHGSPRFHARPINPVVYRGPTTPPQQGWSCGGLVSGMVSRLDAFSGYPSRT